LASGHVLRTLVGHTDRVTSVAFAPNANILVSGSWDKTIKMWDTGTGRMLRTLSGHTASVSSVAYSPNGRLLASGGWDEFVMLWDTASGQFLCKFRNLSNPVRSANASRVTDSTLARSDYAVRTVVFSPSGQILASASWYGGVELWDVSGFAGPNQQTACSASSD
jgi:WD40 repeat protein